MRIYPLRAILTAVKKSDCFRWYWLALLLLYLPAVCGQTPDESIRVGVVKYFPPQYQTGTLNGEPQGFAIDLFEQIAARAGLKPDYLVFDNWSQLQRALREHAIDVIPNMGITADRQSFARFTQPVETVAVRLFVRADETAIDGVDDLNGRRVSVVKTNIGVTLMSARRGPLPVIYSTLQEALLALLSEETDALVFPQPMVERLVRESRLERRIKTVGEALFEVKRALAVRDDNPQLLDRLERAVSAVLADEVYQTIYRRWHGAPTPFWTITKVLIAAGIILLALCAGAWAWRYRTLAIMERQLEALQAAQRERQLRAKSVETAAKLRVFFDQSLYYGGILSLDGRVADVNRTALDQCGYRREEVIGKLFWDTPWWRGSSAVQQQIRSAVAAAASGEIYRNELHYWIADGSERVVDFGLSPVRNDAGKVMFLAPTGIDITERKQAEKALAEAHREAEAARRLAEQANRSKSEFVANISHEIRTPMSAILGYADILAAHLQDPDNLASVATIRRNGRFLMEILNDVLDLTKIEAGKLDIKREPCAPADVISDVHSLMEVRAREKALAFIVEYDGAVPARIVTDPVRLSQILINLIGNAIKFTERGEVRLTVRLRDERRTDAKLQFIVSDTGIGMNASQLEAIFEAFRQGDATTTRRFGGTGLGLTISRQLAALLGGEISVSSEPDKGSTFTLSLAVGDLRETALTRPRLLPSTASAPERPMPRLEGRHVLVVDDRDDIRILAQRLIEQVGGITKTAVNGRAALASVERARAEDMPFDTVVMDMQMPVMDGFEATRRLRAQGFDGNIVALTAGAMLGEREKCLQAGCNSYLSKPVDGRRLIELIAGYNAAGERATPADDLPALANPSDMSGCAKDFRILVVDDSRDTAEALAKMLALNGYPVETAFDGQTALAMAETHAPDALILDLNLPDMSGFDVLARLRARQGLARTLFIALSGEEAGDFTNQDYRFDHWLLKPVRLAELIALLEKALPRARERPEPAQRLATGSGESLQP